MCDCREAKCAVQLGIVNMSAIWSPGFTPTDATVDVAYRGNGALGLGDQICSILLSEKRKSPFFPFYIFPLLSVPLSAVRTALLLQWTPMKKLLISFFNNDDSDNCRRRRLLIRRSMRMKASALWKRLSLSLSLSPPDYLHRLFGSPRAPRRDGASEMEYRAFGTRKNCRSVARFMKQFRTIQPFS